MFEISKLFTSTNQFKISLKIAKKTLGYVLSFCLITTFLVALVACNSKVESSVKKIGIIVPLQHKAMDEIVAGFKESLRQQMQTPVEIKVLNAQGDMNIQRAIIQQMNTGQYDLIVPIGITATQMALSMIHNKPILGLAAHYTEAERSQLQNCNITAVHDEIPPQQSIAFIHAVYPKLTQLTLVHSTEDKVYPQIKEAIAAGQTLGITVHPLLVPAMNELYNISKAIPKDSQGIFVLKDHTIASGIATLAMVANDKQLPLITSDQDSVTIGAGFAVGVYERDIGAEGAKIAAEVLSGQGICTIPILNMTKLKVFINEKMLDQEGQSITAIRNAAKSSGYEIASIGPGPSTIDEPGDQTVLVQNETDDDQSYV